MHPSFISPKWKPYIKDKTGKLNLRFYELCVLWELRAALRGGHLWVNGSYRFANPETYLIPKERWQKSKPDLLALLRISPNGKEVLQNCQTELETLLKTADNSFHQKDYLRFEDNQLIVSRLTAVEQNDGFSELEKMLAERLPKIELPDLLIEVDGWTNFSQELVHFSGSEKRPLELSANLYALLKPVTSESSECRKFQISISTKCYGHKLGICVKKHSKMPLIVWLIISINYLWRNYGAVAHYPLRMGKDFRFQLKV